jgi:DNA-binding transcriptional ArsR family regulator
MSYSQSPPGSPDPGLDRTANRSEHRIDAVDQEAILSLLSDEYARQILDILAREVLSARELTDRMDASRATVYRRLDSLEEAGVVESTMQIHPDGHHRKQFQVTIEHVNFAFEPGGVTVEVAP